MASQRIDYRMQRRALLAQVRDGVTSTADVCDAHPNLVRAGQHLGDTTDQACPICREPDSLRHVTYVFHRRGRSQQGGRAIPSARLGEELARHGSLRSFVVEVCLGCHWHHLLEAAQLERPVRRRPAVAPRRTGSS